MTFHLAGAAPELDERVMVPLGFQRWGEALVDMLDIAPADRVLDVACGTGVTTRLVHDRAGPGGQVDGLDINAPMLAKARDAATLAARPRQTGFGQVAVIRQELTIDVPHPAEFVPLHVGSMPIAQAFADLDESSRERLIADVALALAEQVRGDRMLYPDAVHVVTARV